MSLKLGNTNIAGTQILYSTTGNNTDGAMTQKATTTQLNLKANDADVVHKTGNETITGRKTFTSHQYIKNVDCSIANPPASTSWRYIDCIDSNNIRIGVIGSQINTDGWHGVYLQAGNKGNIHIITDGTDVITYAPTPSVSSNSSEIATTTYINNRFQVVSALPASPDSNVFYFIPE